MIKEGRWRSCLRDRREDRGSGTVLRICHRVLKFLPGLAADVIECLQLRLATE